MRSPRECARRTCSGRSAGGRGRSLPPTGPRPSLTAAEPSVPRRPTTEAPLDPAAPERLAVARGADVADPARGLVHDLADGELQAAHRTTLARHAEGGAVAASLARPKSGILTKPSLDTITFSGFRSR